MNQSVATATEEQTAVVDSLNMDITEINTLNQEGVENLQATLRACGELETQAGRLRADLQLFDHLLDLLGRLLGAMGQVAHLVGDHCEAASGLAGAGGFDGGVEGEQVGLLGDALADLQLFDHLLDLLGRLLGTVGQVAHLVGDHREAASGLAGARGFDGGVEGEQVGLLVRLLPW